MTRPTILGLNDQMLRDTAHFIFMECCISAISGKLHILSFLELSRRNYLIHFVLAFRFLIGNQNLLCRVHSEVEQCATWGRALKKHKYPGHEAQIPTSLLFVHTCFTELNFWRHFLFSSASKNYVKNEKESWVWRVCCDCCMMRCKQGSI